MPKRDSKPLKESNVSGEIILRNGVRAALPALALGDTEEAGGHAAILSTNFADHRGCWAALARYRIVIRQYRFDLTKRPKGIATHANQDNPQCHHGVQ
jgi:hypothetical protein